MVSTRSSLPNASRKREPSKECISKLQSKRAKTAAVRVSVEPSPKVDRKVLQDIRSRVLGARLARSLCNEENTHCFGRVISVIPGFDLDDDLYRVAYEDDISEDVNSLVLFDSLMCYSEFIPNLGDEASIKREDELTELLDLFTKHSTKVGSFLQSFYYRDQFSLCARVVKRVGRTHVFGTIIGCSKPDNVPSGATSPSNINPIWDVQYDDGESVTISHKKLCKASEMYTDLMDEDPTPINPEYEALHEEHFHDAINKRMIAAPWSP